MSLVPFSERRAWKRSLVLNNWSQDWYVIKYNVRRSELSFRIRRFLIKNQVNIISPKIIDILGSEISKCCLLINPKLLILIM